MRYNTYYQTHLYTLISCSVANNAVLIRNKDKASCLLDDADFDLLDKPASDDDNEAFNRHASEFDGVMQALNLSFLQYHVPTTYEQLIA